MLVFNIKFITDEFFTFQCNCYVLRCNNDAISSAYVTEVISFITIHAFVSREERQNNSVDLHVYTA